jgi:hypothetical protein
MNLQMDESKQSERPMHYSKGFAILFGLLLTLMLHLLHYILVWVVLFVMKSGVGFYFYFFGFTQLLYMIPIIQYFKHRDNHGVLAGLIIGASLTFLIGLPYAYACANRPLIRGVSSH